MHFWPVGREVGFSGELGEKLHPSSEETQKRQHLYRVLLCLVMVPVGSLRTSPRASGRMQCAARERDFVLAVAEALNQATLEFLTQNNKFHQASASWAGIFCFV